MAEPRTINQPGNGTATQQFELAPGLLQYVQSVYVEIDNTAGADARPTLTLSEQSGVVIAKKRQGEAIPAAGTGSATWALRLDDEHAATSSQSFATYFGNAVNMASNSSAFLTWDVLESGADLLDLTDPEKPTTREAGTYAVSVYVRGQMGAAFEGFYIILEMDAANLDGFVAQDSVKSNVVTLAFVSTTLVFQSPAGGMITVQAHLGSTAANRNLTLWQANVAKLS